jgi:hypothetical protein
VIADFVPRDVCTRDGGEIGRATAEEFGLGGASYAAAAAAGCRSMCPCARSHCQGWQAPFRRSGQCYYYPPSFLQKKYLFLLLAIEYFQSKRLCINYFSYFFNLSHYPQRACALKFFAALAVCGGADAGGVLGPSVLEGAAAIVYVMCDVDRVACSLPSPFFAENVLRSEQVSLFSTSSPGIDLLKLTVSA